MGAMKMSMKMGMKKMSMKMAMKMAMKKMAMKKSIIARGRMAKVMVFKGAKVKTVGGLKKSALKKNKSGKVVSIKRSLAASKGKAGKWANSLKAAYKKLGLKKFTPCKRQRPLQGYHVALQVSVSNIYKRTIPMFNLSRRCFLAYWA